MDQNNRRRSGLWSYQIGKPRRHPHPPMPLPLRQISLFEAQTAQEPQALNCLGFHFLKPSPMNQIGTNIAELPELLRKES